MPSIHRTPRLTPRLETLEERAVPSAGLVKDVNTASMPALSGQSNFASLNGTVYFAADDGVHGRELWKSDGTADGTALVKDINTTRGSGIGSSTLPSSSPSKFTAVANQVFFVADDGVHGPELWRTDGTPGGTRLVKDILPPPYTGGAPLPWPAPAIDNLTAVNGVLYFTASTADGGAALWKSDGTTGGTVSVTTFQPHYNPAYVGNLVGFQGKVYFVAGNLDADVELWSSDGTPAGTMIISPSFREAGPLTEFKGRLYFAADDRTYGDELWSTDGTPAGTKLFKDIYPGDDPDFFGRPASSGPLELTVVNNTLFFSADGGPSGRELWKSDGTADGTVLVKDIRPGDFEGPVPTSGQGSTGLSSWPHELTSFGGKLYFVAADDEHGAELWTSDGTEAGTRLVKDIRPGTVPGPYSTTVPAGSNPAQLTVAGNTLFFTADDGSHGPELWKSDGTSDGTSLVKDIETGSSPYLTGSSPAGLFAVGNSVFFAATDHFSGTELWKSNSTAAGTTLVKDINRNTQGSNPRSAVAVGPITYFVAADADHGEELWKTDGTAAGTVLVKDLLPGGGSSSPQQLVSFNGVLFFTARDAAGNYQLYRSDGTAAGTTLFKSFAADPGDGTLPAAAHVSVGDLTVFDGKLYFTVAAGSSADLYRTDGTPGGTVRMYRFPGLVSFAAPPSLGGLTVAGKYLYFVASQPSAGSELWRTDGRDTRIVRDINRGVADAAPAPLIAAGGRLFFTADDGVHGRELWTSDGTPAGTRMVKDVNPGAGSAFYGGDSYVPDQFAAAGTTVFFAANDGAHGWELWKSDGTAAGTVLVKDINPAMDLPWPGGGPTPRSSSPAHLAAYNGAVYFQADDGVNGVELWKSDGTAKGTVLLKDIWPGSTTPVLPPPPQPLGPGGAPKVPNSSAPANFTVHQGLLYFTATDGANGTALWSTDGMKAGTRLAASARTPGAGVSPGGFSAILASANGRLYLAGSDAEHGSELWAYTPGR